MKPVAKIRNWQFHGGRLKGEVLDHPRFNEGDAVTTSIVLKRPMNPTHGDTIETKNTIYVLIGDKAK